MTNSIAIVDDDRNILTSVAMALEAEGFQVRAYSDGAEALKSLTQRPADLAILDIKMPRMDGMELLSQLRKQSAMPVIFLTSKEDEVDEVLGRLCGVDLANPPTAALRADSLADDDIESKKKPRGFPRGF